MPEEAHICLSCLTETKETIAAVITKNFTAKSKKTILALMAVIALIVLIIVFSFLYSENRNSNSEPPTDKTPVLTLTDNDGSVITEYDDGSTETAEPDGSIVTQEKNDPSNSNKPIKTVTTNHSEKTTITEKNFDNPVPENSWSEWTTDKPKEGTYTDLEQKIQFRYRDKITTTSSSNVMDGWEQYDTSYSWSDYGKWSNWSTTVYSPSNSRQTESRTVYRFCAFRCAKCGNRDPYRTPCDNCNTSQYFEWEELWYPTKGELLNKQEMTTVPDKYYVNIDGKRWWFERDGCSDGQGGIGQPSRQEYRYRDREQTVLYHFYKWSNWSQWSEDSINSSDTREIEIRTLYRYK